MCPLLAGNHAVTVVFSEPVKSATLSIGNTNVSLRSSEPTNNQKTFSGTLNVPAGGLNDGIKTVTVHLIVIENKYIMGETLNGNI